MFRRAVSFFVLAFILASCVMPAPRGDKGATPSPTIASGTDTPFPAATTAAPTATLEGASPTAGRPVVHPPTEIVPAMPSPTLEAAPVAAQVEEPTYVIQPGTPTAVANFVQPESGCNWMGIGGQAFGSDGQPVTGLVVEIDGKLDGNDVLRLALTGGSQALGPGGFDISLADHPIASQGSLSMRLFNLQGVPQTNLIPFNTYDSCDKNLVIINFMVSKYPEKQYFPLIAVQSSFVP